MKPTTLRSIMEAKGIRTYRELAERSGLSMIVVQSVSYGRHVPQLRTVRALAAGLGVKVEVLLQALEL